MCVFVYVFWVLLVFLWFFPFGRFAARKTSEGGGRARCAPGSRAADRQVTSVRSDLPRTPDQLFRPIFYVPRGWAVGPSGPIHPRRHAPPETGRPPEATLTVTPPRDSAWCTTSQRSVARCNGVDDIGRIARAGKPFCGSRVIGDGVRGLRSAARVSGYLEAELRAQCLTGSRSRSWFKS